MDIADQIKNALEVTAQEGNRLSWSTQQWTVNIKAKLLSLGHENKFSVCTSGVDADCGEWLYDLVWVESPDNWKSGEPDIKDIPLIMECEWSTKEDEIIYDFQKLMVTKTSLRLMIFQQFIESEVKQMFDTFKQHIKNFSQTTLMPS